MNDTDKLNLIKEYAEEYYKNSRAYHFIDNGFIQYEIFDVISGGRGIYLSEIFVRKSARGTGVIKTIVKFIEDMVHNSDINMAYCRVEKDNEHIKSLQYIYESVGLEEFSDDGDALYYRWDKP